MSESSCTHGVPSDRQTVLVLYCTYIYPLLVPSRFGGELVEVNSKARRLLGAPRTWLNPRTLFLLSPFLYLSYQQVNM